jgi:sialic acid synthase SpsE
MIPNLNHYQAMSDHTVGLELWNKYHPTVWEKHVCLEHNDTNPDAGAFAITPEELKEVL